VAGHAVVMHLVDGRVDRSTLTGADISAVTVGAVCIIGDQAGMIGSVPGAVGGNSLDGGGVVALSAAAVLGIIIGRSYMMGIRNRVGGSDAVAGGTGGSIIIARTGDSGDSSVTINTVGGVADLGGAVTAGCTGMTDGAGSVNRTRGSTAHNRRIGIVVAIVIVTVYAVGIKAEHAGTVTAVLAVGHILRFVGMTTGAVDRTTTRPGTIVAKRGSNAETVGNIAVKGRSRAVMTGTATGAIGSGSDGAGVEVDRATVEVAGVRGVDHITVTVVTVDRNRSAAAAGSNAGVEGDDLLGVVRTAAEGGVNGKGIMTLGATGAVVVLVTGVVNVPVVVGAGSGIRGMADLTQADRSGHGPVVDKTAVIAGHHIREEELDRLLTLGASVLDDRPDIVAVDDTKGGAAGIGNFALDRDGAGVSGHDLVGIGGIKNIGDKNQATAAVGSTGGIDKTALVGPVGRIRPVDGTDGLAGEAGIADNGGGTGVGIIGIHQTVGHGNNTSHRTLGQPELGGIDTGPVELRLIVRIVAVGALGGPVGRAVHGQIRVHGLLRSQHLLVVAVVVVVVTTQTDGVADRVIDILRGVPPPGRIAVTCPASDAVRLVVRRVQVICPGVAGGRHCRYQQQQTSYWCQSLHRASPLIHTAYFVSGASRETPPPKL